MSRRMPLVLGARPVRRQRIRTLSWLLVRLYVVIGALAYFHESVNSSGHRWQKSTEIITALVLLAAAVLHVRHWRRLRVVVGGIAGLLLGIGGVVAGASLEEGFDLVVTAFLMSGAAWVLGLPEQRAVTRRADATLSTLLALKADVAALRAELLPPRQPT